MSHERALEVAAVDPLGRRWASARRGSRLYLTWRDADGQGGIQIEHRHLGTRRVRQVAVPPAGLCWRPVTEVWDELTVSQDGLTASGG